MIGKFGMMRQVQDRIAERLCRCVHYYVGKHPARTLGDMYQDI